MHVIRGVERKLSFQQCCEKGEFVVELSLRKLLNLAQICLFRRIFEPSFLKNEVSQMKAINMNFALLTLHVLKVPLKVSRFTSS